MAKPGGDRLRRAAGRALPQGASRFPVSRSGSEPVGRCAVRESGAARAHHRQRPARPRPVGAGKPPVAGPASLLPLRKPALRQSRRRGRVSASGGGGGAGCRGSGACAGAVLASGNPGGRGSGAGSDSRGGAPSGRRRPFGTFPGACGHDRPERRCLVLLRSGGQNVPPGRLALGYGHRARSPGCRRRTPSDPGSRRRVQEGGGSPAGLAAGRFRLSGRFSGMDRPALPRIVARDQPVGRALQWRVHRRRPEANGRKRRCARLRAGRQDRHAPGGRQGADAVRRRFRLLFRAFPRLALSGPDQRFGHPGPRPGPFFPGKPGRWTPLAARPHPSWTRPPGPTGISAGPGGIRPEPAGLEPLFFRSGKDIRTGWCRRSSCAARPGCFWA